MMLADEPWTDFDTEDETAVNEVNMDNDEDIINFFKMREQRNK